MNVRKEVKQIPSAVIETVKIVVVTIHIMRSLSNLAMHSNSDSFAIFDVLSDGIPAMLRFYRPPVVF